VSSAITGASQPQQVVENMQALEVVARLDDPIMRGSKPSSPSAAGLITRGRAGNAVTVTIGGPAAPNPPGARPAPIVGERAGRGGREFLAEAAGHLRREGAYGVVICLDGKLEIQGLLAAITTLSLDMGIRKR